MAAARGETPAARCPDWTPNLWVRSLAVTGREDHGGGRHDDRRHWIAVNPISESGCAHL